MISHYVGVDISLKTAAIAWQETSDAPVTVIEISQTPKAYRQLITRLKTLALPRHIHIVMEATSTYWMELAQTLFDAGFKVSVVNPTQPKYFAKMQLQRAKTDTLDAVMLMEYAQAQSPVEWTPPPAICETLRQLLTFRSQLNDMKTIVKNQLHALKHNPNAIPQTLNSMTQHIQQLQTEIKQLTCQIETLLCSDHEWRTPVQHLLSIPGLGPISAAWLLVATHCFARCETPEHAASFAGLAPYPQNSGSSKRGYRSIGGTGHQQLRSTLYMASASASRFNPILRPYYDKLLARGKLKKVARCAVARKLIHIAWACVTKQRHFDPNFASHKPFA